MPRSLLLRAARESVNEQPTYPCFHCAEWFESEGARNRHIAQAPMCKVALNTPLAQQPTGWVGSQRSAATEAEPPRQDKARKRVHFQTPDPPSSPHPADLAVRKYPKPWVEEVEDKESARRVPNAAWNEDNTAFVEFFPNVDAGAPISDDRTHEVDLHAYIQACGVLADPEHFEVAKLLMTSGLTNSTRDRFLKSRLFRGKTPWENCQQMLSDIDQLPHGPEWNSYEVDIKVGSEVRTQYFVGRSIVQIVRELIGNPEHKEDICYAPQQHWTGEDRQIRIYSEMWTGRWWWRQQILMSKGGCVTIAPLIIASDRTKLATMCGGQQAYPVYVTIGNIRKSVRRKSNEHATILLGYLPCEDFADVKDSKERARLRNELVHRAMADLMAPLKEASEHGVDMWCADGRLRRVYPIVATFVGDWPEQNDMACTDRGGCPICMVEHEDRGKYGLDTPMRSSKQTIKLLEEYYKHRHTGELDDEGLKPWKPWWAGILHVNFHACIAPDLLHQLHQGIFKSHVVSWMKKLVGKGRLDECFMAMPRAQGMRHFSNGISKFKVWTGKESRQMASQFLPAVAGQADSTAVLLVRTALDFMYRAHATQMTEVDVAKLEDALSMFHDTKKILVDLKIYKQEERFNTIPKLHMLSHYADLTRELGTPDGYNTEAPEHLHIEFAKRPWRSSNKVRPLPQMAKFIQRQDTIRIHRAYLNKLYGIDSGGGTDAGDLYEPNIYDARDGSELDDEEADVGESGSADESADEGDGDDGNNEEDEDEGPSEEGERVPERAEHVPEGAEHVPPETVVYPDPELGIARKPARTNVPGVELIDKYGTTDLIQEVTRYLKKRFDLPVDSIHLTANDLFYVWHRFYLYHRSLPFTLDEPGWRDVVRARPAVKDDAGRQRRSGVFNTALFTHKPEEFGLHRYRAGRVRAIFTLPACLHHIDMNLLAYVELFTPFNRKASASHGLHTTSPSHSTSRRRLAAVIPVRNIVLASHIVPQFHQSLLKELRITSQLDLLSIGERFFFNHYFSYFIFTLIEHWRGVQARRQSVTRR